MMIEIHTDNNISGSENQTEPIREQIESALKRFSERITSFQVHLADENGKKGGDMDKRCTIEARIDGKPPIAVTCHADNMPMAVKGATQKIKGALDSSFEKEKKY